MIYLSEKLMNIEKNNEVIISNSFYKLTDDIFFICDETEENEFLSIQISPIDENRQLMKVVTIDEKGKIVKATTIEEEEDALLTFFSYLSYEKNQQNLYIYKDLGTCMEKYMRDGYFYNEENELVVEFMDLFEIRGKAVPGYYEGNVMLSEITLRNTSTRQTIKGYEPVNIVSNLYPEEDDETEYLIECLLDSMSKNEIRDIFIKAIQGETD